MALTAYNIVIACLAAIGGFSYGFGFSIFATSIGMPGFFEYFKLDRKFIVPYTKCLI
jgi:hypothetical protein